MCYYCEIHWFIRNPNAIIHLQETWTLIASTPRLPQHSSSRIRNCKNGLWHRPLCPCFLWLHSIAQVGLPLWSWILRVWCWIRWSHFWYFWLVKQKTRSSSGRPNWSMILWIFWGQLSNIVVLNPYLSAWIWCLGILHIQVRWFFLISIQHILVSWIHFYSTRWTSFRIYHARRNAFSFPLNYSGFYFSCFP